MTSDHPEYTDYIGKVHWTVAFAIPAVLLAVCVIAILILTGCTYNRNAPLISAPLINANGNTTTVPIVGQ